MDWSVVIIAVLGLIGAGLIGGGIMALRTSRRSGVRIAAGAAVSVGLAIWLLILWITPVTVTRSS